MMFALLAEGSTSLGQSNLQALVKSAQEYLAANGPDLVARVIAAALIFLVGRWLAKIANALLVRALSKARFDETLAIFLGRVTHAFLMLVVCLQAVAKLGVDTTSFAAMVAAAGLAVGLALQGSLSNFAAGVMIVLFRPFKVGDFVEAGGKSGIVEEINIFHTMMRTGDNIQLIIPNGAITGGNIANYSAKGTRRIDLVVGCGYGDSLPAVKQFLTEVVSNDSRVLAEPEPVVAVAELGDNSVNFVVRPWVATADYWAVRWDLTEAIKNGFDERGFQIPFPQRDLHIFQGTAPTAAAAPEGTPPTADDPSSAASDWFKPRRVG